MQQRISPIDGPVGHPLGHAATHQLYSWMLAACGRQRQFEPADATEPRDRGAVSLEQVLWFVAAGVSVAVIAKIIYDRIADAAGTEPIIPVSPGS